MSVVEALRHREMESFSLLVLTSLLSSVLSHGESFYHQHVLPASCTGKDFFVLRLEEEGCQPCACFNNKWRNLTKIYLPDVCCRKYGRSCHATQCEPSDLSIVVEEDFCAKCDCEGEGYWNCKSWFNRHECCTSFDKLCECHAGETKTEPTENGCYRCSCHNGFWSCNQNVIYDDDVCCSSWFVKCPQCCADGHLALHMRKNKVDVRFSTKGIAKETIEGVEVLETSTINDLPCKGSGCSCSSSALVKIQFQRLTPYCGCAMEPTCGTRQLRIDLKLSGSTREGIYINVGDSIYNFGEGGDNRTQTRYDAEIVGEGDDLYIYQNENCNYGKYEFKDQLSVTSDHVRIYIGNEYIKMYSNGKLQVQACDACFFGLDTQSEDDTIYVGLNRAVDGSRSGLGVCDAWFHWVCPSKREDWVHFKVEKREELEAMATV